MNISAIIVTYNRIDKLKRTLALLEAQTRPPDLICVVDNNSTDGTATFLLDWKKNGDVKKDIIRLHENTGGSGGFYYGLKYALELNTDWIWVSDDDAFPNIQAFEKAENFLMEHESMNISAICGKVINNGKIDFLHRSSYVKKGLSIKHIVSNEQDYLKDYFPINAFSYVGTLINKSKLLQTGVTNKDYFIWFDDTEHSLRLSKVGDVLCVPAVVINHDVKADTQPYSWKSYYGIRNSLDMYRRAFPWYCYTYHLFKKIMMCFLYMCFTPRLFKTTKEFTEMYSTAVFDAKNNRLGLNSIYKPGWKSSEY